MLISNHTLEGYKPIKYAKLPEDFNQQTHYAVQGEVEEREDHIFIGIEVKELDIDDNDNMDDFEEGE